jgi:hypothetical protein
MRPGDLLLNSYANPELLIHFRPDGTVVQTTTGGAGLYWSGAAILPNGNWVTCRGFQEGVNVFDGVTGAQIATWDTSYFQAIDVAAFSDGTIAIAEHSRVYRYDITGNLIAEWAVSSNPSGIFIDDKDEVWTCDFSNDLVWHTDSKGNLINQFPAGGQTIDLTMAQDGTLFVTMGGTGEVAHFASDGTLLGSFIAIANGWTSGIAMGEDQTIWVIGANETLLRNFDQAGNLLGSFDVGPAGNPGPVSSLITTGDFATNYCGPANPNSTGRSAVISARGSTVVAHNFFTLTASRLPQNVFAYFLNADAQGFTATPPGSQGDLCLAGGIGRHNKQVVKSDVAGKLAVDLDLTALPRPGGSHSVLAGETWNFQCWYRDANPGPTSNFTDALAVTFK